MNTADEILNKLFRYCAYQERCEKEIRQKMGEWGVEPAEYDLIVSYLQEEGFLDDARFAQTFAGGKFRVKRWGRHKIRNELRKRNIDSALIARALSREIPEEAYENSLSYLLDKRIPDFSQPIAHDEKQKTFRFLQQKGYEWEIIQAVWKKRLSDALKE